MSTIPMQIRSPDIVGQLARSAQAAGIQNNVARENRLMQLYREQGPQIAAGDQGALAALSRHSPQQALGIEQKRQQMRISEEQLRMTREKFRMATEAEARKADAAEAAAAARQIESIVAMAIADPENADAIFASDDDTRQFVGTDPRVAAASLLGIKDALEMAAGPKPADEYQRYVQEQLDKGLQPLGRIEYAQAKKGQGVSMTMPDGTKVQVGGGNQAQGQMDVSGPGAMIDTINGILGDPALDKATGILEWTQAIPGTDAYRFGTRVRQLGGQAFLQAFESLKGGGQITEIEGQKATEAIGRLDSGQRASDYREALTELRDILGAAMQRPRGWIDTSAGQISQMSATEIGALDFSTMTPEEYAAAERRLQELIQEKAK